VFSADADFQLGARLSAAFDSDPHQLAYPLLIDRGEWILL
jgi:hypothetical protein